METLLKSEVELPPSNSAIPPLEWSISGKYLSYLGSNRKSYLYVYDNDIKKIVRKIQVKSPYAKFKWAESIYLRGFKPSNGKKLSDTDLVEYVELLKSNKVKYVYLFAGPYKRNGHLPKYPFSKTAQESIKSFKNIILKSSFFHG